MKLLYKHQLLTSELHKLPMIFLGWDLKIDDKLWVIKIDVNGNAVIDWFFTPSLRYIRHVTKNHPTPNGSQIVFGRFVGKVMNPLYEEPPTQEMIDKFGNYLKELIEKYKTKQEIKEEPKEETKTTVTNE
jgi:hypothetical protein